MPRGNKPRISDPSEERMVTLRMSGKLHNLLTKVTSYLNMSHNRFIIELLTVKLHEVEAKIDKVDELKSKVKAETPE